MCLLNHDYESNIQNLSSENEDLNTKKSSLQKQNQLLIFSSSNNKIFNGEVAAHYG